VTGSVQDRTLCWRILLLRDDNLDKICQTFVLSVDSVCQMSVLSDQNMDNVCQTSVLTDDNIENTFKTLVSSLIMSPRKLPYQIVLSRIFVNFITRAIDKLF
jgi:hypothetical protein